MWIAGGFARIIGEIEHNNLEPRIVIEDYFHNKYGDIDIFMSDINHARQFVDENEVFNYTWLSPFAVNLTKEKNSIVKVQMVLQFVYKNFKECLDNFDFTNCKYLIFKENNQFKILKDSSADRLNKQKLLNIDKCISPLLGQRIIKYLYRHKFKELNNSTETSNSIRDYLYKISANNWGEEFSPLGNLNQLSECYIKRVHEKIDLSDDELSILVGRFETNIMKKVPVAYGFYLENIGTTDWASNEIRKKYL